MYEKDDNIVSPRDWYGNGKANNQTTRSQQCHTEICEPGSNKSTMRKPRLPPARSLEITECEPHGQYAHRSMDRIHRPVMTHSCGSWKQKMRGGETNCENGSKVKRQETTGGQGPLRVRSRVLCLSSALKYGLVLLPSLHEEDSVSWHNVLRELLQKTC